MPKTTYVKPEEVTAPQTRWRLVRVLIDDGVDEDSKSPRGSIAVAIGLWDGKPTMAMRWNGHKDKPMGNPQSMGRPTWFLVPDWIAASILKGDSDIKDADIAYAKNFMSIK
jgi:hypothetical protein